MTTHVLDTIDPVGLGERLVAARKARGLTQQQAAAELGVARTTVVAMEKGDRRPRPAELVRLADIYGRKVGDLVRDNPIGRSDAFIVQFRTARAARHDGADDKRQSDIQTFKRLCDDYVELERLVEAPLPRRYPEPYHIAGGSPEQAAEEVAASERNRLGLGDGPVGDLWGLLETDVGLRVFAPPFQDGRLAGLFAYTEEHGGCIAVNGNHPEERRRWTAAHEYAHFLTDRYQAEVTALPGSYRREPEGERFANAFARQFLMSSTGMVRRFQALRREKAAPVTPADLLVLSQLYRVSFQSFTLRLEELQLLSSGTWDTLNEMGFKPNRARAELGLPGPKSEHDQLPARYKALAVQAFTDSNEKLSEGQLANYLRMDRVAARACVAELQGIRFFEGSNLRQLTLNLATPLTAALA